MASNQTVIDHSVLSEIADRMLPGSGHPLVERAAGGVSTPVYRIWRDETTFYLRLAESAEASLVPEAQVHHRLRALGARVPEVIHLEPFDQRLGRSWMVTSAIPGEPIATSHQDVDLEAVLQEAGRDLALINGIEVDGFGWIRRDRPESARLHAELPSLGAFVFDDLERQLLNVGGLVSDAELERLRDVVAGNNEWFESAQAFLAHGDFDTSHIYHVDGVYSGIIDFGEIRGADRWYDLGHFALHDGEHVPRTLLPHLLAGYGEVTALPPDHVAQIRLWALLVGVRTLARIADRPRTAYHDFLAGSVQRLLAEIGGRTS